MALALRIENLSKAYQIGQFNTGALSQDLERWWALLRGKEDPFLKIGEANDRSKKGDSNIVWSLRDINLEVNQGDSLGIIGKNGAGKSTLLKILSRVTSPTIGNIKIKGRVASLLEVGTGFHPELTGRENIFLNGSILGMRHEEIRKHFDEIVDFAGVERYIDTPVKRYSSGMYVRLAFAVAAHLESEILIVDEVLAVGDAEFQKKCISKMGNISKNQGRTILFVSHNMSSIRAICNRSVLLADGNIEFNGESSEAVEKYLNQSTNDKQFPVIRKLFNLSETKSIQLTKAELRTKDGVFEYEDNIILDIFFLLNTIIPRTIIRVIVNDSKGNELFYSTNEDQNKLFISQLKNGSKNLMTVNIPGQLLKPGNYFISIIVKRRKSGEVFENLEHVLSFRLIDSRTYRGLMDIYAKNAIVAPNLNWSHKQLLVE